MEPMEPEALSSLLERLSLPPTDALVDGLWRLTLALDEWADKLGLSTIRGFDEVLLRHVLDSLLLTRAVPRPSLLIDIGTGPGAPALPLALAWPETRVIAIDSRRRSNWLVEKLARDLPLPNVEHLCVRAEDPDTLAELGGRADLVCSRGLAKPRRAVELSMPYVRPGGAVAVLTGPEVDAMALLPSEEVRIEAVPGTDWQRRILLSARTSGGE